MKHPYPLAAGIPVAPSLEPALADAGARPRLAPDKQRLLRISLLAVLVAVTISLVARLLVYLINGVTNVVFHGELSVAYHSPATNHLGGWVVLLPAIGGLLVSLLQAVKDLQVAYHSRPADTADQQP